MKTMMEILKETYPLRWAPASPDTDRGVKMLCQEMPFKVYEYKAGTEHNGWVVPMSWYPVKGIIKKDGDIIYDGMHHPLAIIGYSQSFKGTISLEELKKHLFSTEKFPDALVYHCDLFYKVGQKDWGFCMPLNQVEALQEGLYEVELETCFSEGTMKVLEYTLEGQSKETIILNAHNCHAAQANDDIAGVVVGMEVMNRLKDKERYFTYKLIIAPEHFGTVFYLAGLDETITEHYTYGMFLEMLGNSKSFSLQKTFTGDSLIDRAAVHYLTHMYPDTFVDAFRKIIGNDETVWEAPGYEVPTLSLSRFPYPEYHTNLDNEEIILSEKLEESVSAILGILNIVETNSVMERRFKGLVALSNPKYDLYIQTADPSMRPTVSTEQRNWNYLMDCIPRYFDMKMTILDICERHDLFYEDVYAYLMKFQEKELIRIHRINDMNKES